jgi:quinoprotein glucose dehydrogenase
MLMATAVIKGNQPANAEEPAIVDASKQGVFTREQATRGRAQYVINCSACHMEDLAGGGPALPLAGDVFLSRWSNQTVYDLYRRIRTTMPQSAPASLTDPVYRDIVAFILRANNFPAGATELPADAGSLSKTLMSAGSR